MMFRTVQDRMQNSMQDGMRGIRRNMRRLVPYVAGVMGSYGIVQELLSLWYGGSREDMRAMVFCLALWALLWTRAYGLLYLMSAAAVCLCPVLHISPGRAELGLLLCSFVSARAWDRHRAVPMAGCIVIAVLSAGSVMSYMERESVSEGALWMERHVNRVYASIFGESEGGWFENGSISRGNNYRSGGIALDVAVDQEPTEDIYLRNYIGADYQGDRWTEADESVFYNRMADLTAGAGEGQIQILNDSLYFILNYGDLNEWIEMLVGRHLFREDARKIVVNRRQQTSRRYVPYYSFHAVNAEKYYRLEEDQAVDTYFYFESADMDTDEIKNSMDRLSEITAQIIPEYDHYVRENYLSVPKERLSRLWAFCEGNVPVAGAFVTGEDAAEEGAAIDAVTAFIRAALQTDAVYTRTPGSTPVNQDVIEYFLFESRRGYCMHYASAATLMYRMYGIPARYVTGYVAHPEDFERQADGTYAAALTDYRLHAWVEIYQENLGWTPVEMTPIAYYAGELPAPSWLMPVRTGYAGAGNDKEQGTLAQYTAEEEEDEEEEEEGNGNMNAADAEEEEEEEEDENTAAELTTERTGRKNSPLPIACGALAAVMCLGAVLWYRRRFRLKRLEQMDERRLFYRLLKLLHSTGRLRDCTGTEEDFEKRLLEALPGIEEKDAAELMRIAQAAAYGPECPPKGEERRQMYLFYTRAAEELFRQMNLLQKLYCVWILNLC